MCAFGWLVEPISLTLIAWIWGYNLVWMFLLCAIRLITERFVDYRTARHIRSLEVVNQSLQTQG
jgi:H+-transporting ATPase